MATKKRTIKEFPNNPRTISDLALGQLGESLHELGSLDGATTMASPSLAVSIDRNGNYYLDAKKTAEANLENALKSRISAMGKEPKGTTITVVAEKGTSIEDVVFILDIANRLQVKTILAFAERV